jgi:hypothetical protein
VTGNMRDGIMVDKVLDDGPAQKSGQLSSGRILGCLTVEYVHYVNFQVTE